ncbi:MAG TPA: preprotein translocase subunit SecE [Hydrogenophaga sp.]|mgnify:CR=1 FL=1|uniref:preprotein translocase subunit SecE n=1 Tax=Hydrogenophaga sp. TaxID=1904254 RepID=UPI002C7732FC|nr:preprotein translocase subunit SecE [Hydrogenophaga sp.]HMN92896.1 preprotein translocase subunit SecE [Hydrogenophaga sp.]HMP11516.1 preprotein translocase subunit SecE [Hydrogenophaga sp.]
MATPDVETVQSGADKAKMAAAAVLALGGFVAYFLLTPHGGLVQWAALLLALGVAAAVFLTCETGRQLLAFWRDSWREVKKVVWPARKEAIQMTLYVFVFVFVMGLFLWLTDKTLEWVFFDLILGWR